MARTMVAQLTKRRSARSIERSTHDAYKRSMAFVALSEPHARDDNASLTRDEPLPNGITDHDLP